MFESESKKKWRLGNAVNNCLKAIGKLQPNEQPACATVVLVNTIRPWLAVLPANEKQGFIDTFLGGIREEIEKYKDETLR